MYVVKLDDAGNGDEFGTKASSLAGMRKAGLPVPDGFVITPRALELFINTNQIGSKIRELENVTDRSPRSLREAEEKIRDLFTGSVLPSDLRSEIASAYGRLSLSGEIREAEAVFDIIKAGRDHELVAVRSSLIKDPMGSFSGVTESFVNTNGEDELFRRIKMCWASLFYPYVRLYRERKGLGDVRMAVVVQRMAESEKSGVMLTGFGGNKMLVEGTWGLGHVLSSGMVTPDEYLLDGSGKIIEKNISKKLWMYSRNEMTGMTEKNHVPGSSMDAQVLIEGELEGLFAMAGKISSLQEGQCIIDWAIGRKNVVILDSQPVDYDITPSEGVHPTGDILVTGRYVSRGNVSGSVRSMGSGHSHLGADNIVVSGASDCKELLSALDAGGFVTDEGGRLCNFGVLSRELNIPALSATRNGTSVLREGESVQLVSEQGKVLSLHIPQEQPAESSQFPVIREMPEEVQPPDVQPLQTPVQEIQNIPMPFEQEPMHETPQPVVKEEGVRVFAKVGADMIDKVHGADGFIVFQMDAQPSMLMEQAPVQDARPVWITPAGEHDIERFSGMARGFVDSGRPEAGMLLPVVRGEEDIGRMRHQVPAGVKFGLSIKTPAMAAHSGNMITGEVSFVNIELDPLVQLSMGLKSPDHALHSSVLDMIKNVKDNCGPGVSSCCVTMSSSYATDWNIEMLTRNGIDAFCVEPGIIEGVKNILSRISQTVETGNMSGFHESGEQADVNEGDPFGFSPSSFS